MTYINNILQIKNLCKKYKNANNFALENISMDFTPGIYGILGANCAGKSTLFK